MKFEGIRVGDKVLIEIKLQVGWGSAEHFWCLQDVEKITSKQFQVNGSKYRKEDGRKIDSSSYGSFAKQIGDKCGGFRSSETMEDQTGAYILRKKEIILISKAKQMLSEIKIEYDQKNIGEIYLMVEKLANEVNKPNQ